jgi:hypothetical protein
MESIVQHSSAVADWKPDDGLRLASSLTINRQGNRVIGGSQRYAALLSLGQDWVDSRDVTWVDCVPDSPAEIALNIALNSADAQSDFDWKLLAGRLTTLRAAGADLKATALDETTISLLTADNLRPDFDEDSKSIVVRFTPEQWDVVRMAIARARSLWPEPVRSDGGTVAQVCAWYLEASMAAVSKELDEEAMP